MFDTELFSALHCYLTSITALLHIFIGLIFSIIFFIGVRAVVLKLECIAVIFEFLAQQIWGEVHTFAFLTQALVIVMLLFRGPHSGNRYLPSCPPSVRIMVLTTQLKRPLICESFLDFCFTETQLFSSVSVSRETCQQSTI